MADALLREIPQHQAIQHDVISTTVGVFEEA